MTAANPNGPRAQILAAAAKFRQEIVGCLEEGPMTNEQMCERLGCEAARLRSKLSLMVAEGHVHTERIDSDHAPFQTLYHLGPGECIGKKEEKQRMVSKWKPQTFKPDPILAALFGAPQQKGE